MDNQVKTRLIITQKLTVFAPKPACFQSCCYLKYKYITDGSLRLYAVFATFTGIINVGCHLSQKTFFF